MANINDILNDPWGPYTHAEVEAALKAYFTTLEQRISQASPQGGIGLSALSQEVQALLAKADTALQSESDPNVASWAKSQNKPEYNANEVRYNTLLSLKQKLDAMDAAITAASQSGSAGDADNGIEDISASGGVVVITLSSGDTYTIDLNHTHSGYASLSALAAKQDVLYDSTTVSSSGTPNFKTLNGKSLLGAGNLSLSDLGAMPANATVVKAISVNGTDVQLDENGKAAITVSGGGGGISDVTYNNSSIVSNGVAVLDSVIPDVSGKANASELSFTDGTGANADKTTIQLKSGLSRQVLTAHQSLNGRVQSSQVTSIVVLASQSDYDLIQNPDSNTLYLIKESNA